MRVAVQYPISEIVPHAGNMSLLDTAVEGDQESLVAEAVIRDGNLFYNAASAGTGAWIGIEYMAQTVAAWAGWQARLRGGEPRVGYLLGTRRYHCSRSTFRAGEILRVEVHRQFQADNGLGQFECHITIGGEQVASAALTLFEPAGGETILEVGKE